MEKEEICLCGTFNHRRYRFVAGMCSVRLGWCSIHMHNHIGILRELFVRNRYAGTWHPTMCAIEMEDRFDKCDENHLNFIRMLRIHTLLSNHLTKSEYSAVTQYTYRLCLTLSHSFHSIFHLLLSCHFDIALWAQSSSNRNSFSRFLSEFASTVHRMLDNVITHYLCSKSNQSLAPQPFRNERVNGIIDRK